MKKKYTLVAFLFVMQFSFGQIGFTSNIIIERDTAIHGPKSVYAADIDNDGDIDILSAASEIVWYENLDGQGTFGNQQIITTDVNIGYSIYASDLDGDGDLDVLSVSGNGVDNKVAWYENLDGQGDFGSQQIIYAPTTSVPRSVYASDIDSDGDMDVLSGSGAGTVWYENTDGQGTFGTPSIISETYSTDVYTSDIDGDGDMDVLISSIADKIVWYQNLDSLGSFGSEEIISTNVNSATSVYATDIDGDGDIDVLSSSDYDDKIAWYENIDGLGTFGTQQIISTNADGATSVYSSDIDGDGDFDVLSTSYVDHKIAWYENIDGLGNFGTQQIISSNSEHPNAVYTSDINGDGYIDVIFTSEDSKIGWFENLNGTNIFSIEKILTTNVHSAAGVHTSDLDGDEDLDILVISYDRIIWYENLDGQGLLGTPKFITTKLNGGECVYTSDLDNDGDMDVLSASRNDDKIAWYENLDGVGTFGYQQILAMTGYTLSADGAKSIYSTDLDGDDDMDILFAASGDDKIGWYENLDSQGTFGTQQIITSTIDNVSSFDVSDIDGDGDKDVLFASASFFDGEIGWYENIDGQGTFGDKQIITFDSGYAISIKAIDIDEDGDMDVVLASRDTNKIAWYENMDGQGNFGTEQIITSTADGVKSLDVSDIDGDGDIDVLSASEDERKIAWYENTDGLGSFSAFKKIGNYELDYPSFVFSSDLDGDGDFDVFSSSTFLEKIEWHENLGVLGNELNGFVSLNLNNTNCDNNISVPNIMVVTSNGVDDFSTFTQDNGSYIIPTNEGDFNTSVTSLLPSYFNTTPNSYSSAFNGLGNTDTGDFCIEPTQTINDLNISVYPSIDDPRPGFDTTYQIVYNNIGTIQLSGDITFEFDDAKVNFLNASESLTSQTANTLTFNFTDLNPFETKTIDLEFNVFTPPTTNIGDDLITTATINPVTGDNTPDDNVFTLNQTVIGSYDPNDIRVLEGEEITLADTDKYLHYIIRFQNTGTASAINVNVENMLDPKLDWTTMQLESLSHTGRVEITNGNMAKFIFNNINLQDSTNDEPNSHGFIAYKIKLKSDVIIGDTFHNAADIFFDFNPAIVTNTVATTIVNPLSVDEFEAKGFSIHPNPTSSILNIESKTNIDSIIIYDLNGRILRTEEATSKIPTIDVSSLPQGMYFIEVISLNNKVRQKFIKK